MTRTLTLTLTLTVTLILTLTQVLRTQMRDWDDPVLTPHPYS